MFRQIVDDLKRMIEEGNLPDHAALPSERVVAEQHGVSRMTARRALEAIEAEGLAYSKDRQGRFVSPKRMNYNVNSLENFITDADQQGIDVKGQVIATVAQQATADMAEHLGVSVGTELVQTQRLFLREGHAMFLETETVIPARCHGLQADPPDTQRYSTLGHMADITIRMRALAPNEAAPLGLMPYQAGIEQEQMVRDADGILFCHVRQIWRGELAQFSARAVLQGP
ncbi:MAG: GntR family transcriptional regulator [Roseovarius sp.]